MKQWNKKLTVRIAKTKEASQRTKNRIHERGPFFQVERHHLDGQSWLMREVSIEGVNPNNDGWLGWLPINEFRVIEEIEL